MIWERTSGSLTVGVAAAFVDKAAYTFIIVQVAGGVQIERTCYRLAIAVPVVCPTLLAKRH